MRIDPVSISRHRRLRLGLAAGTLATAGLLTSAAIGQGPNHTISSPNATGVLRTIVTGPIDRSNPFFQPLGKAFPVTCEHCHFATDAWAISADHARQLFDS